MKIAIIDYDIGNVFSVANAIKKLGHNPLITRDHGEILAADRLILPGVGNFSRAIKSLKEKNLIETIKKYTSSGKPFLGICIGMHLMMDYSEESGSHQGLGLVKGSVKNITDHYSFSKEIKIPHISWSSISCLERKKFYKFNKDFFYFVHSYCVIPDNKSSIIGTCNFHNVELAAIISQENLTGVQFHPERSGERGLKFLKEFID